MMAHLAARAPAWPELVHAARTRLDAAAWQKVQSNPGYDNPALSMRINGIGPVASLGIVAVSSAKGDIQRGVAKAT
jgi:hypothetical protein